MSACVLAKSLQSCLTFVTPWTVIHQAPLSVGFSRQEHWSGLPCPPPQGLPHPGTEPTSLMSLALAGGFFTSSATWEALYMNICEHIKSYIRIFVYIQTRVYIFAHM